MTKIGFIGLGTMGGPMAANIIKGGYDVKGFDINPKLMENHTKNNGTAAGSASEAAINSDILFTMLPNAEHVKSSLFDKNGAVENLKKGSIVIDVGINRVKANNDKGYKIVGDADWDSIIEKAASATPVPGGIGPMTIAMLVENTIESAENLDNYK